MFSISAIKSYRPLLLLMVAGYGTMLIALIFVVNHLDGDIDAVTTQTKEILQRPFMVNKAEFFESEAMEIAKNFHHILIGFSLFSVFSGVITAIIALKLLIGRDEKIASLNRLYQTRSVIDQAVARIPSNDELFTLACRCAVDAGGMVMAFISVHDDKTLLFHPVARYGIESEYVDCLSLTSDSNEPEGNSAIATAFRENRSVTVNGSPGSSMVQSRNEKAVHHGWRSSAAFPILRDGKPFAVLSVCNVHLNAFTHDIISELEQMLRSISFAVDNRVREDRRKEAEESLHLAAQVYESSSEGMVVTDLLGIVCNVNAAFSRVTGYTYEEVIGKPISILKSGQHGSAFYTEMWTSLNTVGYWKGEIWNRRKNGEIYPEWLSINTVYSDGVPFRRVALFTDITDEKKSQDIIWQQANFDPLTGLSNRRMFLERLDQEIKKTRRTALPLALLYIDLDHFKEVNDTLGHDMGDHLLREAAERLRSCVRETDVVGRLGGDEFTVMLVDLDDLGSVNRVVENILPKIAGAYTLGGQIAYLSASIGITLYPEDADNALGLLKNADQAMYEAKRMGRNRSNYFTPSMQESALNRVRIATDLRAAIKENQFQIYYQPIVNLATGEIAKAEALVRWQHPTRGLVSPADFIPVAEETGLIVEIGEWVFREAARQASRWKKTNGTAIQISINKSPVQFRQPDIDHHAWSDYLISLGLTGESIAIEITEGMLLERDDMTEASLISFRDADIQVSLDDFGTGYSSLSYLKKFDIDYLKIDQSFVRGLVTGSSDAALCEAIIVMAHKLGMKVIAEGVETASQRDLLIAAGCDYGQGYLFSRPVPEKDFTKFLGSNGLN